MPLRDHFRPPFSQKRSWEEFHGQWPAVIVQQLGKILPPRYSAGPRVQLGVRAEVNVASFEEHSVNDGGGNAGTATATWSAPTLTVETELGDFDEYEVRVYDEARSRQLVAAIELISPANKDRPESRQQFVSTCAALLRNHVSVVLVDVVSSRTSNLYSELLTPIGQRDPTVDDVPTSMYAVACRWTPQGARHRLEAWHRPLTHGQHLPTLPLWLEQNLAVSLDLEASYEQTCQDLRIPPQEA